jgi:hypothetical protein
MFQGVVEEQVVGDSVGAAGFVGRVVRQAHHALEPVLGQESCQVVEVGFVGDEEGGAVEETLKFGELRDFEANGGKGRLVENSPFLSGVKMKIETNQKIRKSIEQNRKLRDILKEAGSREELKEVLQSMLSELEEAK